MRAGGTRLTFWDAFFRTLKWRPLQALAGLYWHVTRRKVRARNRLRLGAAQSPYVYDVWMQSVEDDARLRSNAPSIIDSWLRRPKFSVLVYASAGTGADAIRQSLASVHDQFYSEWELIVTQDVGHEVGVSGTTDNRLIILPETARDDAQVIEAGIRAGEGDFVVFLRAGNLLAHGALMRVAEALQGVVQPSIIYGDQDEIGARGRRVRPWFKPEWDAEMFLAQDYLGEACAIDLPLAQRVLPVGRLHPEAATFSLLLAAIEASTGPVAHVPHILAHIQSRHHIANQAARVEAVERHLERLGATASPGSYDTVRVRWPLPPTPPGVSIIVPTRDKVELLRACVDGLLEATSYPTFELIIIDNGSTQPEALAYLSTIGQLPRVRVIAHPHPYNYSAINNLAVDHAAHPFLCLLNNDTEVMAGDWLTEMMRYAVRPQIGAVGAKLLYDDGSIQHAGVVIGICEAAGHAHRYQRSDEAGYFAQPHIAHAVSAVTAACLVVEKSKFLAVGGLDADSLAVAYNDVDLCLKLEQAGWTNMYVPHAVLLHHESKSRGLDTAPKNRDRYMRELSVLQTRWATKTYDDPRHNPNLDRYSETFSICLRDRPTTGMTSRAGDPRSTHAGSKGV